MSSGCWCYSCHSKPQQTKLQHWKTRATFQVMCCCGVSSVMVPSKITNCVWCLRVSWTDGIFSRYDGKNNWSPKESTELPFYLVADLGGGGGGGGRTLLPLQGFDPLPTQRAPPPLYYFEISIFGWLTLKFSKQSILILREGRAPKKRNFLVQIFQKVLENAFFGPFFLKNLPAAHLGLFPFLLRLALIFSRDKTANFFANFS